MSFKTDLVFVLFITIVKEFNFSAHHEYFSQSSKDYHSDNLNEKTMQNRSSWNKQT